MVLQITDPLRIELVLESVHTSVGLEVVMGEKKGSENNFKYVYVCGVVLIKLEQT